MVKKNFIPRRGDIVSIQFNPQSGKEQSGRRPAIVISPESYNKRVGLILACPITSKEKGYPFEVVLPKSIKTRGVILSDHIKSMDWKTRHAQFIEKLPQKELLSVIEKISMLIS